MGNGMNRVLPGLYVGNYRDSKDASQLERHKITHIIAIHDAARRMYTDKEYLCIMASDSPYQNLSQYFSTCNDFIHSARIQGGNVLIHCLAGMSRSVTIAVAYIMSTTSLRWNEALKVVRGARAVSNPNSGFQKQLQDFEASKLNEERRRLLEKFPESPYIQEDDEEQCKRLLTAYNNMVLSRVICEGRCATQKVCPTGTCKAHQQHGIIGSPRLGLRHQKSSVTDSTTSLASTTSNSSSTTSSSSAATTTTKFTRAPSTKSLDSSQDPQQPSSSPKKWERHYGSCWKKTHVRQSSNSTPSTPILYRATKRTDSVTSISSLSSSITSLGGSESKDNVDTLGVVSSSKPTPSSLERSPLFLATQSCPNSPRRTQKLSSTSQQRKNSVTGKVDGGTTSTTTGLLSSTKQTNNKACSSHHHHACCSKSRVAVVSTTSTKQRPSSASAVLTSSNQSNKVNTKQASSNPSIKPNSSLTQNQGSSSTSSVVTSCKVRGERSVGGGAVTCKKTVVASASVVSTTTTTATAAGVLASSSGSSASSAGVKVGKSGDGSSSSSGSGLVGASTTTVSGTTRWVMKRSAYKYSLDKS